MTLKAYVLGLIEANLLEEKQLDSDRELIGVEKATIEELHQQILDLDQRISEILNAKK